MAAGELVLGGLLAEGGEGRVFEVVSAPPGLGGPGPVVYKQLRSPRPLGELRAVVAVPGAVRAARPELAERVRTGSSWPLAVVVDEAAPTASVASSAGREGPLALGALLPRAPERFRVLHRDGSARLAGLSYLATDPDRVELAYGVDVPAPGAAERVAIVLSLALLLEALQEAPGAPPVAHGDLSARNVLWSLAPAPEVYVIDCDGAAPAGGADRPRVTTPNWEDPALRPGGPVSLAADRYALGLTFLRVVGAANFPLQGRQRSGAPVAVDLELPRSWRRLPDMAWLWRLCERSLSVVGAEHRPAPSEWVAALRALLAELGQPVSGQAAGAGATVPVLAGEAPPDVEVRPVLRHRAPSTWQLVRPERQTAPVGAGAHQGALAGLVGLPVGANWRSVLRAALGIWAGAHRLAARLLARPGRRRHGARRLAGLLVFDLAAGCVALFLTGMVVSPWIGL